MPWRGDENEDHGEKAEEDVCRIDRGCHVGKERVWRGGRERGWEGVREWRTVIGRREILLTAAVDL